ncbi:MAG: RES domain-containing protein [Chlorobium sp.]|nr:RES domain-containing protein [Chlorobium sp.]
MGYAKAQMEKGFSSVGDTFVCADCFEDYAIQNFIESIAENNECDYCGETSEEAIAAPIDNVIEFIVNGIESEYENPGNSVGWCSAEGGWVGTTVCDSYELVKELVEVSPNSNTLIGDIIEAVSDREWCHIDPYGNPMSDEWFLDWEAFCEGIKHNTRYVFYRLPTKKDETKFYKRAENPYDILEEIGKIVKELEIIETLPVGTEFVRVRPHAAEQVFTSVQELGPPQIEYAKFSNRMSPAGIPMFYGSFDEKTALAETSNESKEFATSAIFRTLLSFKVLNLSEYQNLPSIFDEDRRFLRQHIIFLRNFIDDIAKPVVKDGTEHYEYVPTQVVTEYFRHIFKDDEGDRIQGIIYPSSVLPGGKACVLFFQQIDCTQDNVPELKDKWLNMITASIKTASISVI